MNSLSWKFLHGRLEDQLCWKPTQQWPVCLPISLHWGIRGDFFLMSVTYPFTGAPASTKALSILTLGPLRIFGWLNIPTFLDPGNPWYRKCIGLSLGLTVMSLRMLLVGKSGYKSLYSEMLSIVRKKPQSFIYSFSQYLLNTYHAAWQCPRCWWYSNEREKQQQQTPPPIKPPKETQNKTKQNVTPPPPTPPHPLLNLMERQEN